MSPPAAAAAAAAASAVIHLITRRLRQQFNPFTSVSNIITPIQEFDARLANRPFLVFEFRVSQSGIESLSSFIKELQNGLTTIDNQQVLFNTHQRRSADHSVKCGLNKI